MSLNINNILGFVIYLFWVLLFNCVTARLIEYYEEKKAINKIAIFGQVEFLFAQRNGLILNKFLG